MPRRFVKITLIIAASTAISSLMACYATREQMIRETENYRMPYMIEKNSRKALIYIVRPVAIGFAIPFPVYLNDPKDEKMLMGSTKGRQYIYFYVDPGTYTVYSQAENTADIKIEAKAGQVIFIEQVPTMGVLYARNHVALLDDVQGKYHLKSCREGEVLKNGLANRPPAAAAAADADKKEADLKKGQPGDKTGPPEGKNASAANNPRNFALGLNLFKEHGFGLKIRGRYEHFAVDGSVGLNPWLVILMGQGTRVYADVSIHADLAAVFIFNDKNSFFQNGLKLGAVYDTIGGAGGLIGWTGEFTYQRLTVSIGLGLQFYPWAYNPVKHHFGLEGTSVSSFDTSVSLYFGVSVFWYAL